MADASLPQKQETDALPVIIASSNAPSRHPGDSRHFAASLSDAAGGCAILELEEERIVGIKNVTVNEPFFVGHFPEFPVMPGVLVVEAMAQVAGVLVLKSVPDRKNKLVLLASIEQAKFRRPVRPGDQLRIEMKVTKRKASIAKMHGKPPWTEWWWPKPS
jgi:beta-hydroxyacyl-ACP dehydratase FabZ